MKAKVLKIHTILLLLFSSSLFSEISQPEIKETDSKEQIIQKVRELIDYHSHKYQESQAQGNFHLYYIDYYWQVLDYIESGGIIKYGI